MIQHFSNHQILDVLNGVCMQKKKGKNDNLHQWIAMHVSLYSTTMPFIISLYVLSFHYRDSTDFIAGSYDVNTTASLGVDITSEKS